MPDHLAFCVETVFAHHPRRVQLLTTMPAGCRAYFDIPEGVRFKPAHEADLVRAWLLAFHGGFWIDCDYLCFRPIEGAVEEVFEEYDTASEPKPLYNFASYKRPDFPGYDNDFLWARSGSRIAANFLTRIRDYLITDRYQVKVWGDIGSRPLTDLFAASEDGLFTIPFMRVSPLRQMTFQLDAYVPPGEEWQLPPETVCMSLVNSVSGEYLRDMGLDAILASKTVIGNLYRLALKMLPKNEKVKT